MKPLRYSRSTVFNFQLVDLPRGVGDNYMSIIRQASRDIDQLIDRLLSGRYDHKIFDALLSRLQSLSIKKIFTNPEYSIIVATTIANLCDVVFSQSIPSSVLSTLIETMASTLLSLRLGSLPDEIRSRFEWKPLVDFLFTTYASNDIIDNKGINKHLMISKTNKLLKEIIWLNPKTACIDSILENLSQVDLSNLTSVDFIEESFTILSFFNSDFLGKYVCDPSAVFWSLWIKAESVGPIFQPRLELYYLTVLAKLDWNTLMINDVIIQRLCRIFTLTIDHMQIPSSATLGTAACSAAVETAGINRAPSSLLDYGVRKIFQKFGRLVVSLIWSSGVLAEQGWSFLTSLISRSEKLFLPCGAEKWSANLGELIQSITHHWLKRTLKAAGPPQSDSPDHEKFVFLLFPGIANVTKSFFSANVRPNFIRSASNYLQAYIDLIRICPKFQDELVFNNAIETLSDSHKAMSYPLIFLGTAVHCSSILSSLESDSSASFLSFLIQFSPESIDPANLFSTVSVLAVLDRLFAVSHHRFTLYDLSSVSESTESVPSRLLTLSTMFPDWSCLMFEKFLFTALAIPKPKSGLLIVSVALSSEAMESLIGDLLKSVWMQIVSNVDAKSTFRRFFEILKEFFPENILRIDTNPHLIGFLVSELMRVCALRNPALASDWVEWVIAKQISPLINSTDSLDQRRLAAWLYIASQSLRYIGLDLVSPLLLSLTRIFSRIISFEGNSMKVVKAAIKTVQRTCESVSSLYIREFSFFIGGKPFENTDWWSGAAGTSGVVWYNPLVNTKAVKEVLDTIRTTFAPIIESSKNTRNINLRLIRSIAYGCRVWHDVLGLANEIDFAILHHSPASLFDHKRMSLWIKAVGAVLPSCQSFEFLDTSSANLLAELGGGFRADSADYYSLMAKDLEILDESRFTFLTRRLSGSVNEIFSFISSHRPELYKCERAVFGLFAHRLAFLCIETISDQNRLFSVSVLSDCIECLEASGSDEMSRIVAILIETIMRALSEKLTTTTAKGISALCMAQQVWNELVLDVETVENFLTNILSQLNQLGPADASGEISAILIDLISRLWTTTVSRTPNRGQSNQAVENLLKRVPTHSHWKLQLATLISSYILWKSYVESDSDQIVQYLSAILATSDGSPLSASLGQFVVHWLSVLLARDNQLAVQSLSTETLVRVAKIFSLVSRFGDSRRRASVSGAESPIDRLTKSICQTAFNEHCGDLFNCGSIPKVSNTGVVESHVVFWWLLGDDKLKQILPHIIGLIPSIDNGHSDDDLHCVVLEFLAASSQWDNVTVWKSVLLREIMRGDGAMIPTVATAIRMSFTAIGPSSLQTRSTSGISDWCMQVVAMLLDNIDSDCYRFLSVLDHSILVDTKMCQNLLKNGQKFTPLLDWCKYRSATDQVREVHSSIIGRLASIDSNAQAVLKQELERVMTAENCDDREIMKQKVSVVKAVGRLIRFTQSLPTWYSNSALRLALDLVPNNQDDVKQVGVAFIDLVARFLPVDEVLSLPIDTDASVKEIETILSLKVRVLVRAVERRETTMTMIEALVMFQESVIVNANSHPALLSAYKAGLTDMLVLVPEKKIEEWIRRLATEGRGHLQVIGLCALIALAALYHDTPQFGLKSLRALARLIETNLDTNMRKVAETTISEFMKILTDRGTRDKTEKLLDSEVLAVIKSAKAKQSYIS